LKWNHQAKGIVRHISINNSSAAPNARNPINHSPHASISVFILETNIEELPCVNGPVLRTGGSQNVLPCEKKAVRRTKQQKV